MNRYESATPRAAFGIAALAMTALVIGLSVVLPAKLEPRGEQRALAVAPIVRTDATEVAVIPAVDVIAVREPQMVQDHSRQPLSKHNQSS